MSDRNREKAEDATASTHNQCSDDYQELHSWLKDTEKKVDSFSDVIDANDPIVHDFRGLIRLAQKRGSELFEEGRLLRLGIIGQIKAGKSSLLNSLLFEGGEVLPMAATPMTASLTHIVKSEDDVVEIKYYSREEWDEIRRLAKRYQERYVEPTSDRIGTQGHRAASSGGPASTRYDRREPARHLKASFELVKMTKENNIDVDDYIGKCERHPHSVEDLNQTLRQLVGAEGKLAPLVKSVKIQCRQGIPELDIVDTPGINDPVISRALDTHRLLSRCDALMLLSYAGQFMDSADAVFFHSQEALAAGSGRRLLLGSKFDSALIDEARSHCGDLDAARKELENELKIHALESLRRTREDGNGIDLKDEDILFISSMCADLATRPVRNWSQADRSAFARLCKSFPDWLDPADETINEETKANLLQVSGWTRLSKELDAIRRDKDAIIAHSTSEFISKTRENVKKAIGNIAKDYRERRDELLIGDLGQNKAQLEKLRRTVENATEEMERIWAMEIGSQCRKLSVLLDNVYEDSQKAKDDIRNADTLVVKKKKMTGLFPWLMRQVGGGGFERYETQEIDKDRLRTAVEAFRENVHFHLEKWVGDAFPHDDRERLLEDLAFAVSDEMPSELAAHLSFNPKSTRRVLRRTISDVCRSFKIDMERSLSKLDFQYGGLNFDGKSDARAAVLLAEQECRGWLKEAAACIEKAASAQGIVDQAFSEIGSEAKRLEMDHEKGEFQVQRYSLAVEALTECIEETPR